MTTPVQNQRVLMTRIRKIEDKQAERFPMLLERLAKLEKEMAKLKEDK
jgi:hypothetical protein